MTIRSGILLFGLLFLGGCSSNSTPVPASKDHAAASLADAQPSAVSRLNKQLWSEVEPILATEAGERETARSVERVKELLAQGADPNTTQAGSPTLVMAASNGHIVALKMLLDSGADIDAQDDRGRSALMYAAGVTDHQMVQLLLARGASVSLKDHSGFNAMTGAELIDDSNPPPAYLRTMTLLRRASAPGFKATSLKEPVLEIPLPRTVLHRDGVTRLPLARTLNDMHDLEDAIRNGHDLAALAMKDEGKFQMVFNDTEIEVLDRNPVHCRVKIKTNPSARGWVLCDWIRTVE